MAELLRRGLKFGVAGALVLLGLILFWVWMRIDTTLSVFQTGRAYLHESLGLSANMTWVLTAAGAVAAFLLMSVLWPSPKLAALVVGVLLMGGVPLAYWVDTALASKSCFHRKTGEALCERWQSPRGCVIVRADGAQPPTPWRRLRAATQQDVEYCAGSLEEPQQEARTPRVVQLESCEAGAFFDGTGVVLLYWSREQGGEIRMWDRPGAHPITGVPLKAATAAVAREYCEQMGRVRREREQAAERERAAEAQRVADEAKAQAKERGEGPNEPPAVAPEPPRPADPYANIVVR